MKLCKSVMHFVERDGKRAVKFSAPGTEYSLSVFLHEGKLRTSFEPPHVRDLEVPPDAMEMLIGQSLLFILMIKHYLGCDKHAERERLLLAGAHEELEKGKVKFPCSTEHLLLCQVIGLQTGLGPQAVKALGLAQSDLDSQPTEAERKAIDVVQAGGSWVNDTTDVTLDFQAVEPPLTADERQELARVTDQKAAEATVPNPTMPPGTTIH